MTCADVLIVRVGYRVHSAEPRPLLAATGAPPPLAAVDVGAPPPRPSHVVGSFLLLLDHDVSVVTNQVCHL